MGSGYLLSPLMLIINTLFDLYVLLVLPFSVLQWLPQLLQPTIMVAIVMGLLSSAYIGYLTVVNLALAGSLLKARDDLAAEAVQTTAGWHPPDA